MSAGGKCVGISLIEMDNFEDLMNKLKQTSLNKPKVDVIRLEQCHREFKNELNIKKTQVEEMRKEIDTYNLNIYKLNRELEKCKAALKETTYNFNLVLHKSRTQDDQVKELNENYVRLKVKQEMTGAEIETLNSHKDEISHKTCILERTVQDLEAKCKYQALFQRELQDQHNKFLTMMNETKSLLPKLESEQKKVFEFRSQLTSVEESHELSTFLCTENDKLKTQNRLFEEQLWKMTAKYEKLEELLSKGNGPAESNLTTKLILLQWKTCSAKFKQEIQNQVGIIEELTEAINREKSNNAALIRQNKDIDETLATEKQVNMELVTDLKACKQEIEELRNELKCVKADHDERVKKEIIEIE